MEFKEPSLLKSDWLLGQVNYGEPFISNGVLKSLKNFHLTGIEFLYNNWKREIKGAILNEDSGMNMQLQVCAFLNALRNKRSQDELFQVLVLCPDHLICKWHYHLTKHGDLTVQIIREGEISEDNNIAYIVSFNNIKLVEYFVDLEIYSVIVDRLDLVATKLILRKLNGSFKIGLTKRNFIKYPDPRLKWFMLNWTNPGCVGKLHDFYAIDLEHYKNFIDNYRFWWLRLTWNFCESLQQPTEDEKQIYRRTLENWGTNHDLPVAILKIPISRSRKKLGIVESKGEELQQNIGRSSKIWKGEKKQKLDYRNTLKDTRESSKSNEVTVEAHSVNLDEVKNVEENGKYSGETSHNSQERITKDIASTSIVHTQLTGIDEDPILSSFLPTKKQKLNYRHFDDKKKSNRNKKYSEQSQSVNPDEIESIEEHDKGSQAKVMEDVASTSTDCTKLTTIIENPILNSFLPTRSLFSDVCPESNSNSFDYLCFTQKKVQLVKEMFSENATFTGDEGYSDILSSIVTGSSTKPNELSHDLENSKNNNLQLKEEERSDVQVNVDPALKKDVLSMLFD